MIDNQTIEQLRSLRLDGMLGALNDPATTIATSELSFDQRLSLLCTDHSYEQFRASSVFLPLVQRNLRTV